MIRKFTLLATAAAIVAIPQIAQAGCNGAACAAISSTTNYSASDKRVRATVTNKDESPIHLKFCINVDYHCNGFDETLAPHQTITRDVAFSGAKPPQIHAVDVVTAEFPKRASAGPSPGVGSASAAIAVDTPRGRIMYFAAKQSVVAPLLARGVEFFKTANEGFSEARGHSEKMHELSDKLGSIKDIEAEVAVLRNGDGGKVRDEAHIAQGAELQLSHFASTLKLAASSAEYATANLKITEDDLQGAEDMQRAREMRAEAEKTQSGLSGLLKVIGTAADIAIIATPVTDPGSKLNSAIATVQKAFDLFAGNHWVEDAEKLEAKAQQLGAANAARKFASAKAYMTSLTQQVAELQARFPEYQALAQIARNTAEQSYDSIAVKQKSKINFNFARLQTAIQETEMTIAEARKLSENSYLSRQAFLQLQHAGDWMAFPNDGSKALESMSDDMKIAFDWSVAERQSAELLLKKFNEMYAMAHAGLQ